MVHFIVIWIIPQPPQLHLQQNSQSSTACCRWGIIFWKFIIRWNYAHLPLRWLIACRILLSLGRERVMRPRSAPDRHGPDRVAKTNPLISIAHKTNLWIYGKWRCDCCDRNANSFLWNKAQEREEFESFTQRPFKRLLCLFECCQDQSHQNYHSIADELPHWRTRHASNWDVTIEISSGRRRCLSNQIFSDHSACGTAALFSEWWIGDDRSITKGDQVEGDGEDGGRSDGQLLLRCSFEYFNQSCLSNGAAPQSSLENKFGQCQGFQAHTVD